jgi:hypothetical protein
MFRIVLLAEREEVDALPFKVALHEDFDLPVPVYLEYLSH